MKLTDIKKDLKNRLSERRYVHSAGVAASAYILAEKYGYNPKKAELAGWLHDCAKEMKLEEMQDIIDEQNLQVDEYMRSSRALLHGPAGSIIYYFTEVDCFKSFCKIYDSRFGYPVY